MKCEQCFAICHEADKRCYNCGTSLRTGIAAHLPQRLQLVGMMIGAAAVPIMLYNPKLVTPDNAFLVKAVLAGIGGGIGAVVGRVVGVVLASVTSND